MSFLSLFVLFTHSLAQNPGVNYSITLNDFSTLVQRYSSKAFDWFTGNGFVNANYSVSYGTFTTTTINVNFTDVTMLNATYDSSKTLVVFSEPNYLNFTLYGINVYASMNTTSATGSTVQTEIDTAFSNNNTWTFDTTFQTVDRIPQLNIVNYNVTFNSFTIQSNILNSYTLAPGVTNLNQVMANSTSTAVVPIAQKTFNKFLESTTAPIQISNNTWIDMHWNGNATIFYQPGLIGTQDYITAPLDGTIMSQAFNTTPTYEGVSPAKTLPTRITNALFTADTQVFVSDYTLETYYANLCNQKFNVTFTKNNTSNFPDVFTTSNGYFPELLEKYGNKNVTYTAILQCTPTVTSIENYSTIISVVINLQINIEGETSPFELEYSIDFTGTPEIVNLTLQMYPTTFRILNINQVTTDVTVQLYNYYEFGNLFLASLIPEYYQYFYPQAPLPVSNSTTVERFISRVGNGYAVADFDFYQAAQFS